MTHNDFLKNDIIREDMHRIYLKSTWSWLNGKTVFISGAYGMLASYCVYFLIYLNETYTELNIKIIAQGRNHKKMYERFGKYINRPYFLETNIDICQNIQIENNIDYIIHAASLASPQYYAIKPVDTFMPNTIGTYNLLELAREKNTDGFLFFSSGDIYGKLPDSNVPYTEEIIGSLDPLNIRSCYGESKRMGETMCKAYSEQYGVKAKCVRIAHTYGPTLDLKNDERLFSEFVKNIVNNENILMKSDGSAVRMFCYLSDATDAFFKILRYGRPGEAYNMCNENCEISVKELAYLLIDLFPEKRLQVIMCERDNESSYIESPIKKAPHFSMDKLKKLNWNPEIGIKEGFQRTILSYSLI